MKVYQIIAEDYDNTSFLGGTSAPSNTGAPADASAPSNTGDAKPGVVDAVKAAADAAKTAVAPVTNMMPDLGIDLTTLAITGVSMIAVQKLTTAGLSKLSADYARKLKLTQRVERMWKTRYGPWGKVFGVLGLAVAVTQLYENLYVLEAMYVQGKLDQAKLVEQREFEFGVFTAQVLAPTVTKWALRSVATLTGAKYVIRVLGGVSVKATLGASIAAVIASEAFIRWFQYWLGTENGKAVIYDFCGGFIRTMGKPADSLWDIIMNAYQGVTGSAPPAAVPGSYNQADVKKHGSQEKADAANKGKKDSATSISGRTNKTGIVTDPAIDKTTGKLLNPETEIVVTDGQGKLLNNAALMANAPLNLIRRQAVAAGLPDPLAKFAAPGQALPAIT
jgi:hypothetical protein